VVLSVILKARRRDALVLVLVARCLNNLCVSAALSYRGGKLEMPGVCVLCTVYFPHIRRSSYSHRTSPPGLSRPSVSRLTGRPRSLDWSSPAEKPCGASGRAPACLGRPGLAAAGVNNMRPRAESDVDGHRFFPAPDNFRTTARSGLEDGGDTGEWRKRRQRGRGNGDTFT